MMMQKRTVAGMERTVTSNGVWTIKEYRILGWQGLVRRPWRREHRCLRRLEECGVRAPRSLGYTARTPSIHLYRREFVPGLPVLEDKGSTIQGLAEHLARVHEAGVVMGDLSLENLLRVEGDHILLIDYGRGRVFFGQTPLFFWYVGKELARCRRRIFPGSTPDWEAFQNMYRKSTAYPAWGTWLLERSMRAWLRRWNLS